MTNPGIAAPLSRARHQKILEATTLVQERATEALAEIDQALAEAPPSSARRRSTAPSPA
ncbi:MAG TPA: hypothetical protein VF954_06485 [Acidimicrobiales bacterium]